MMTNDEKYMWRAIQLAKLGHYDASPNPMVGAVIVHNNRIIGEGWHRQYGSHHAEVNAVAAVKQPELLCESTLYVTLEPCSHYGKTPPCANLIIEKKIPRVVVAMVDPFDKVAGRGISMLRENGVDVKIGVLENEARKLNERFICAHTYHRPRVTLKWARSADGFMDWKRDNEGSPARFSTPLTSLSTHRLRSLNDAILTTADTVIADNPLMTVRYWSGRQPVKVIIDRKGKLNANYKIFDNPDAGRIILFTSAAPEIPGVEIVPVTPETDFSFILDSLYRLGITSVLVEAGPKFLQTVIDGGLWDVARVETSPVILGENGTKSAPILPSTSRLTEEFSADDNRILFYER